MFGACLRVSETIGLTWSDVDMKNREIHVGGQLVHYEGDEGYCFHDSETKPDAGIRDFPMTQMVYDAFRKQRELNLSLVYRVMWRLMDAVDSSSIQSKDVRLCRRERTAF